jgi:tetratricopeptide (TPR) repeat protein
MSVTQPDKDRRLLPRWQTSEGTIALGELLPEEQSAQTGEVAAAPADEHFEFRLLEWEKDPSPEIAAELVGSALVLGRSSEVQSAAKLIADAKSEVSPILHAMALQALGEIPRKTMPERAARAGQLYRADLYRQISQLRHHVQRNPRDAYAWVDLARLYTILGQIGPAQRAVFIALAVAPEDRFVLRASARFFVHVDEADHARSILSRARATKADPWLMSAEIAVSQVAGRSPRMAAHAQRSLKLGRWTPRSGSELAGSLATLLLDDGASQQARQLFRQSLRDPTENAVAQAQWAAAKHSGVRVPAELLRQPDTYEARALRSGIVGDWVGGISQCWQWLEYEPTSTRPMIAGSFYASVAYEDGKEILAFTERGLDAEPNNSILLNNKAVGLVYEGRIAEAEALLLKTAFAQTPLIGQPALLATGGLILFRSGAPDEGRKMYMRAADHPYARQDRGMKAFALWHLAREEVRQQTAEAEAAVARAEAASKGLKFAAIDSMRARVTEAAKQMADPARNTQLAP